MALGGEADASRPAFLSGTSHAHASGSAHLSTPVMLAGTSSASASAVAQLTTTAMLAGTSAASSSSRGDLTVAVPPPALVATTELEQPTKRQANADDYTLVLVPLATSGFTFAIVAELAGGEQAAVWAMAVFLVTCIAMRDDDWTKLVAKAADWLKPPQS